MLPALGRSGGGRELDEESGTVLVTACKALITGAAYSGGLVFSFSNLFGNHEIDQWRDEYTLLAASTLNEIAGELIESFEEDLRQATWRDGLLGQGGFIASRVTPTVHAVARPVVEALVKRANDALLQLVQHQAAWQYEPVSGGQDQHATGGWQDVAVAAGPLAGGVAIAAALPAMAVTTSTAFFGLVTTTAVSWPVVVGGGAVAGIAIATGVLNTGRLWDKTEARLRKKVRDHVVSIMIQGSEREPAVLEQLRDALADAAEKAKRA